MTIHGYYVNMEGIQITEERYLIIFTMWQKSEWFYVSYREGDRSGSREGRVGWSSAHGSAKRFKRGEGHFSYQASVSGSTERRNTHSSEWQKEHKTYKSKGGPKYEIIEEEFHVYIIVDEERYELFEGEGYWYYIDMEGEKHYIAFERRREWVGQDAEGQDERYAAFEEYEAEWQAEYEAEMAEW